MEMYHGKVVVRGIRDYLLGMAFRIHDSVVRGELDNRVKGLVRGRIWLAGRAEPLLLELTGNAAPDLAGCRLEFTNQNKPVLLPQLETLQNGQTGVAGDLTASRKVRVLEVPVEEALELMQQQAVLPEHLANCLYLEWFSAANGRVVLESTDFTLTVSAPEWRLTPAEEAERVRAAETAMADFMKRLTDVIESQKRGRKNPEEPWDEFDYEKLFRESDARTDKYMELLDKYGDMDDARIEAAMGWDNDDEDDDREGAAGEEGAGEGMTVEEMNAIFAEAENAPEPEPDPAREGIDWIRTAAGDLRHPLQHRCHESALRFSRQAGRTAFDENADRDWQQFVFEFHTTAAKLAGALNIIAQGRVGPDAAFTVAYLKRALDHLHKALAGLEAVATKKLLPDASVTEARREMFAIREGILKLMDELRGRG